MLHAYFPNLFLPEDIFLNETLESAEGAGLLDSISQTKPIPVM